METQASVGTLAEEDTFPVLPVKDTADSASGGVSLTVDRKIQNTELCGFPGSGCS